MIADVLGRKGVTGVELTDGTHVSCDAVAMAGGWSPIVNLACHRGAKPMWDERILGFVPPDTARPSSRRVPPPAGCCCPNALRMAQGPALSTGGSLRFLPAVTRRLPPRPCGG